jgi:hypothetical protein
MERGRQTQEGLEEERTTPIARGQEVGSGVREQTWSLTRLRHLGLGVASDLTRLQ